MSWVRGFGVAGLCVLRGVQTPNRSNQGSGLLLQGHAAVVTVHLVEFEGRGGPFQHSVAMAEALHRDGVDVVLHTASDPEFHPGAYVPVCLCMDWLREAARARGPRIALRFLFRTLLICSPLREIATCCIYRARSSRR